MKTFIYFIYSVLAIVLFAFSPIWLAYICWFIDGMPDNMQEQAALMVLMFITFPMGIILIVADIVAFVAYIILNHYHNKQ